MEETNAGVYDGAWKGSGEVRRQLFKRRHLKPYLYINFHQNSIFIKFFKILKIHETFCLNPRTFFVLFYNVHKENMFTIKIEDGREAP